MVARQMIGAQIKVRATIAGFQRAKYISGVAMLNVALRAADS